MALITKLTRGRDFGVFFYRRNFQPGESWFNLVPFVFMADLAFNIDPICLRGEWWWRIDLELACGAAFRHVVHGGDEVERRMAARTFAVDTAFGYDEGICMGTAFPFGLDDIGLIHYGFGRRAWLWI